MQLNPSGVVSKCALPEDINSFCGKRLDGDFSHPIPAWRRKRSFRPTLLTKLSTLRFVLTKSALG